MIYVPEWITDSHKLSTTLIYATMAHEHQVRKYTGEMYIMHPIAVCSMLKVWGCRDMDMLQAALLHDVVEDTPETHYSIIKQFGPDVADIVLGMTKGSIVDRVEGNRADRHAYDIETMKTRCAKVHTIKCADIIHNAGSIVNHDKKFAKVWLNEKLDYLGALHLAPPECYGKLNAAVTTGLSRI
jgi:(p)ppGpp synthase/HD superfamily hydrolase